MTADSSVSSELRQRIERGDESALLELFASHRDRLKLGRLPEAIDAFTNAIRLRPRDAHVRANRGIVHLDLGQKEPAIDDLEAALELEPDQRLFPKWLSEVCTARAWELATGPEPGRDLGRALALAR